MLVISLPPPIIPLWYGVDVYCFLPKTTFYQRRQYFSATEMPTNYLRLSGNAHRKANLCTATLTLLEGTPPPTGSEIAVARFMDLDLQLPGGEVVSVIKSGTCRGFGKTSPGSSGGALKLLCALTS